MKFTEEHKKKIGLALKGRIFSEETRKKMSEKRNKLIQEGKIMFSEETRKKMSEAQQIRVREGRNIKLYTKGQIAWNKGQTGIYSDESLKKMSLSHQGKKSHYLSELNKQRIGKTYTELYGLETAKKMKERMTGKNNPMYGKKHTENTLKIISERCGLPLDKNPRWLGGKSFEPYNTNFNKFFKESIRERDNYCCSICNRKQEELGYSLSVHHIDYDKKNSLPQNCIALCRNHHTDTNMNRQSWIKFFHSLLTERYGYEYTEDQKIVLDFTKEVTYDK